MHNGWEISSKTTAYKLDYVELIIKKKEGKEKRKEEIPRRKPGTTVWAVRTLLNITFAGELNIHPRDRWV